jgi:hypothetical protein
MYATDMTLCGMIHMSSFMKTGGAVPVILRFYLRNLMGCNVSITERRVL